MAKIGRSEYATPILVYLKKEVFTMSLTIYPSIINIELSNIEPIITKLDRHVPGYHIDLMDGIFVKAKYGSPALVNEIARTSSRTDLWLHLMVNKPQDMLGAFLLEPGSIISFHFESQCDVLDVIKIIKEKKWQPSIAISPKTAVEKIFPFLNGLHQVLLMSVEPGYSGQTFLPEVFEKIQKLSAYKTMHNLNFRIAVDGGIDAKNIAQLAQADVQDVAVASAIFNSPDPIKALEVLKALTK